jgi:hypothetical protein
MSRITGVIFFEKIFEIRVLYHTEIHWFVINKFLLSINNFISLLRKSIKVWLKIYLKYGLCYT